MISSPLSIIEATVADLTPTLTTAQEDAIVEALADASHTMREVAETHGLSMAALALWAARPDIQHRLSAFEDLIARQVRTSATAMLRGVALTLHQALDYYREEENHTPADYTNPRYLEQRRRARTSATQAARLLLRIADHRHIKSRVPTHASMPTALMPSSNPTPPHQTQLTQQSHQTHSPKLPTRSFSLPQLSTAGSIHEPIGTIHRPPNQSPAALLERAGRLPHSTHPSPQSQ